MTILNAPKLCCRSKKTKKRVTMKINQNNRHGLLKRETMTRVMTIIESTKALLRIRNVFTRICTDLAFHFDADPERIRLLPYPSVNLWKRVIRWKSVFTHFFHPWTALLTSSSQFLRLWSKWYGSRGIWIWNRRTANKKIYIHYACRRLRDSVNCRLQHSNSWRTACSG